MAIFMVLSMAACGGGGETDTSSGESGQPVASAAGQGETLGEVESGSAEESASVSDPSTALSLIHILYSVKAAAHRSCQSKRLGGGS